MFTIEEARITRPAATRQIPHGATLEYKIGDIRRAVEEKERVQERARIRVPIRQLDRFFQFLEKYVAQRMPAVQPTLGAGRSDAN